MDAIAFLLGWPALIAALLLAASGFWYRRAVLVWPAVVLVAPMALYLSGSPAYPLAGAVPLGALVLSALTCRGPRRWPSLAGVGIYAVFLGWLAYLVVASG